MFVEKHGESWQKWVVDSVNLGCDVRELFSIMTAACWSDQDALLALQEARGISTDASVRPTVAKGSLHTIDGHVVRVLSRLDSPSAVYIENLLTEEEVDSLLKVLAEKETLPSGVVDNESGKSVNHKARTSSGIYVEHSDSYVLDLIADRVSKLTDWPKESSEAVQILKYEKNQQYEPHYDWFNKSLEGSALHLKKGGQRVGTTVVYLQCAEEGGGTRFPRAGFEVFPARGSAIFFADVDSLGKEDVYSLHAGTPVIEGTKIIATFWQRESTV